MKKRIVIAMVTGLMLVSLAGCGTQADATNQSPESSSAVESQSEPTESGTESNVETEPESTESSETTSEEVVGDNTETSESGDLEDENIILYAEKREKGFDYAPGELEYTSYDGVIHADVLVPLFDADGYVIGEMKMGGTAYVTEVNNMELLARFKNPIEGTEYDYLYTGTTFVKSTNITQITAQDAENVIKKVLGNEDIYTYTEVTDDMELCEFRIPIFYDETENPEDVVYFEMKKINEDIWYHYTFAVVCTEDTDDYIICQVYYKD